jgi:hypothetical protein
MFTVFNTEAPKMNNIAWFDIIGLLVTLAGAIILALGLIVSRKQALKIGVSRVAEDNDDKNIHLPHVRDELRESRFALIGLIFLIIGFLLQLMAALPL